jgi:hypothetical protein
MSCFSQEPGRLRWTLAREARGHAISEWKSYSEQTTLDIPGGLTPPHTSVPLSGMTPLIRKSASVTATASNLRAERLRKLDRCHPIEPAARIGGDVRVSIVNGPAIALTTGQFSVAQYGEGPLASPVDAQQDGHMRALRLLLPEDTLLRDGRQEGGEVNIAGLWFSQVVV